MSIALVLIPLALPAIPVLVGLRLVLGKEGFQRMIDSMQVKIPTSLRDEDDLARTITASGYDFQAWLGGHKTHLPGGHFFTWEFDGTKWSAVFSKGVPQSVVAEFIRTVEAKTGRAIFSDLGTSAGTDISVRSEPIPTNFRDETLLIKTLADAGAEPVRNALGNVTCSIGDSVLRFVQPPGEPYQVEVESSVNRQALLQELVMLDEEYRRCVQAETYQHLKAKIGDRGLAIESEEVLEDNSIVLTLIIDGQGK